MGNSSSSTTTAKEVISLDTIKASGRYLALPREDEGTVHVIGVYPCSARSVTEVTTLCDAVKPSSVYVDVPPELLAHMEGEVKDVALDVLASPHDHKAFQLEDEAKPSKNKRGASRRRPRPGAPTSTALTTTTPSSTASPSAAPPSINILSAERRKALENPPSFPSLYTSLLGIMGTSELRTNIADDQLFRLLGLGRDAPYLAAVEWATANKKPIVPYPISIGSANHYAVFRAAGTSCTVVGAPPFYTDVNIVLGTNGVPQPDVSFEVAIPPEGFFSYDLLRSMRKGFVEGVMNATKDHTMVTRDSEKLMRENCPEDMVTTMYEAMEAAAKQQCAAAYEMQYTCEGPDVVAVVDLARLAGVERGWERAAPAEELFPEPAWYEPGQLAAPIGMTGAAGGLGYLTYRAAKRFPKTTALVSLPVYSTIGMILYAGIFRSEATNGTAVRQALANPKQPFSMF